MKYFFTVILILSSVLVVAQDDTREVISGKIIVEGNELEGISIFNTTSLKGTISDENGIFTIAVALNDRLEVRALEYNNFDIIINDAILESKQLRIYLIERITELDEIVLNNRTLTGNLAVDVKKIVTFNPKLDAVYIAIENDQTIEPSLNNIAQVNQGMGLTNGLNVVNIVDQLLIPLFRSEATNKETKGIPEVPVKSIRYYFGSTFITENFDIPDHRVEEFIRYVEDDTFDYDLLNYGREMEFLELLNTKSKEFLKK